MAISKIAGPSTTNLWPAYNPIDFLFNSTNVNEEGFRYVVDIYKYNTATKIAEFRVAPRSLDGYGLIQLSRIMQNLVSYDYNLTFQTDHAINSGYSFDIKMGEEYLYKWSFQDYVYPAAVGGVIYTALDSSSNHTFIVGDQVVVTLDTTYNDFRDQLNGLFTVLAVPAADQIVIDIPWIGSGAATPGKVKYADNRKTVFRNLLTIQDIRIFNGALNNKEYLNYNVNRFVLTNANKGELLTNAPNTNYYIRDNALLFVNLYNAYDNKAAQIYWTNSNGDVFKSAISINAGHLVRQAKVGPGHLPTLTLVSGTAGLIKSDTLWYEIYFDDSNGNRVSEIKRFYIDRSCEINDIQMLFLDRLGSIMSFPFTLRSKKTVSADRQKYNKQIEYGQTYKLTDHGYSIYNVNTTEVYEINSNWLTDEMSQYFEELLTSGFTLIKIDGDYYSCNITTNSQEILQQLNKRLIRYTITVELALKNPVNI